jgi:hypothetical protein
MTSFEVEIKGYKTEFSCASHLYKCSGFIIFEHNYQLPNIDVVGFHLVDFADTTCIRWVNTNHDFTNNCSIDNINGLHENIFKIK